MNISINTPLTLKLKHSNFYYFLAGLIDQDQHFSKIPQLVICFNEKDATVAYLKKKQIQYGIVSKIKNKKAYKFVISHSKKLEKVCLFVNNKLQHQEKIKQYNTRLCKIQAFQKTVKKHFTITE